MLWTEPSVRSVVLAAGESRRTRPVQKLLAEFRGRRLIDYAIEAALPWQPIIVAGADVASELQKSRNCPVALNDHPERGMSHSLKIADAAIDAEASLLIFLGDKPFARADLAGAVCRTGAQIAFPVHALSRAPGHPVFLHASVRSSIRTLNDGDTLHRLRDDPKFVRTLVPTMDEGAFFDVDHVG